VQAPSKQYAIVWLVSAKRPTQSASEVQASERTSQAPLSALQSAFNPQGGPPSARQSVSVRSQLSNPKLSMVCENPAERVGLTSQKGAARLLAQSASLRHCWQKFW
jgi:hypothetical protein